MIIFRHPNKGIDYDLKVKIDGKRLYQSDYVKYLGVLIDPHLKWDYHIDFIAPKLTRAIGMLSKIRSYVDSPTLRTIYFGIYSSIMLYAAQVWGQIENKHVNRVIRLQDKAVRVINFSSHNDSRGPLYKNMRIIKFTDSVNIQKILFTHDFNMGKLPEIFNDYFMLSNKQHDYYTRAASKDQLILPRKRTVIYGIRSITFQSAKIWNNILKENKDNDLSNKPKHFCKKTLTKKVLDSY